MFIVIFLVTDIILRIRGIRDFVSLGDWLKFLSLCMIAQAITWVGTKIDK